MRYLRDSGETNTTSSSYPWGIPPQNTFSIKAVLKHFKKAMCNFFRKTCFGSQIDDSDLDSNFDDSFSIDVPNAPPNIAALPSTGNRNVSLISWRSSSERDLRASLTSLDCSPVISYGRSPPPLSEFHDVSQPVFLPRKTEKRKIEEIQLNIAPVESQKLSKPVSAGRSPVRQTHAQKMEAKTPVSNDDPLREGSSSYEPCEAPKFALTDKNDDDDLSNSTYADEEIVEHSIEEMRTVPLVARSRGQRVRYSHRRKRESAKKAKGDCRKLSSDCDQFPLEETIEDLATSVADDVEKKQTILESRSSYQENLADLGIARSHNDDTEETLRLVEEIHSFLKDINKAAEDMLKATKRRSDLFVERLRMMDKIDIPKPQLGLEYLLEKLEECEKHNEELTDSLTRAKELLSAQVKKESATRIDDDEPIIV